MDVHARGSICKHGRRDKMATVTKCMLIKLVLNLYFLSVSSCASNTNVFTATGSSAALQYDANRLSDEAATYRLKDPQGKIRAQFVLSTNMIQTLNLTFTGDTSTGDISFRIDNVQTLDTGVYEIVKNAELETPLRCNTVYITGSLSVPSLTSNKTPSVGESVTLTCSSSSTTVPAGLSLVYTWQVDGATNPTDSRFTYSTTRDTLTVSGVQKSDAVKVFIYTAKEEGSRITSSSSSQLRMNVLYSGCPINTNVFTTTGSSATLQYDANSLPFSDNANTYQVIGPEGTTLVQFLMKSGHITSTVQTLGLTFTGENSTGVLSFRIDNVETRNTGLYKMVRVTDPDTPLLCNTVLITGDL